MADMDQTQVESLISKSKEALKSAYCPYSNFPVGAALVTEDGTVFLGCNVENAAYGLAICAERTAVVKAVSEGHKKFKAIAISSSIESDYIGPCGSCRQFLVEFSPELVLYLTKVDSAYKRVTIGELLPMAFTRSQLLKQ